MDGTFSSFLRDELANTHSLVEDVGTRFVSGEISDSKFLAVEIFLRFRWSMGQRMLSKQMSKQNSRVIVCPQRPVYVPTCCGERILPNMA